MRLWSGRIRFVGTENMLVGRALDADSNCAETSYERWLLHGVSPGRGVHKTSGGARVAKDERDAPLSWVMYFLTDVIVMVWLYSGLSGSSVLLSCDADHGSPGVFVFSWAG